MSAISTASAAPISSSTRGAPVIVIAERSARAAIFALEASDRAFIDEAQSEDLSRSEMGSVEGDVIQLTTYHGQPAIRLRERLHGWDVPCVLSAQLAERIGHEHGWFEVWAGRRIQVIGELLFRREGHIGRVIATDIKPVDSRPLTHAEIADRNFTGGLPVRDYLDQLWEDEVG